MGKYSKAVSEMYSQFKQKEAHPAEKYIGQLVRCGWGEVSEVVGYTVMTDGSFGLIIDCSSGGGWPDLGPKDGRI